MTHLADDFVEIAKVRRQLRMAEGLGDDNWRTAGGQDLDACAAAYDIYRKDNEYDTGLRSRIEAAVDQKKANKLWIS
jgi:hypothetical protein